MIVGALAAGLEQQRRGIPPGEAFCWAVPWPGEGVETLRPLARAVERDGCLTSLLGPVGSPTQGLEGPPLSELPPASRQWFFESNGCYSMRHLEALHTLAQGLCCWAPQLPWHLLQGGADYWPWAWTVATQPPPHSASPFVRKLYCPPLVDLAERHLLQRGVFPVSFYRLHCPKAISVLGFEGLVYKLGDRVVDLLDLLS